MPDPMDDDKARNRWMAIVFLRLGGAAMIIIGLLIVRGRFSADPIFGWFLLAVGLVDFLLMPTFLARKWRSPRP
ncbi:MAG: hypothetical protein ABIT16_10315 [Croceibacterium sp.]